MARFANRYSIDSILDAFPVIENKYGVEICIDDESEKEIVEFIRENKEKFIAALDCALGDKKGSLYKDGPECSKEFRFVKSGKFQGAIQLNSRIYTIHRDKKIILCLFLRHKDEKDNKVPKSIINKLSDLCKSEFNYSKKQKILIMIKDKPN